MIIPPTDCFWLIHAEGEAAEYVASQLSPGTMNDIAEVILVSEDFSNDVQAGVSLDAAMDMLKQHLSGDQIQSESYNPLYIPSTKEQIDSVMMDITTEAMKFVGMDENPFTTRMVGVTMGDKEVLKGKITFRPFELPTYPEILRDQENVRLN